MREGERINANTRPIKSQMSRGLQVFCSTDPEVSVSLKICHYNLQPTLTSRWTSWGLLAIKPARPSIISQGRWMWLPERENLFSPERRSNCIYVCPTVRSNSRSRK